jgi:glucuronoarabinoxylan endo-1,4-beta-xylanase
MPSLAEDASPSERCDASQRHLTGGFYFFEVDVRITRFHGLVWVSGLIAWGCTSSNGGNGTGGSSGAGGSTSASGGTTTNPTGGKPGTGGTTGGTGGGSVTGGTGGGAVGGSSGSAGHATGATGGGATGGTTGGSAGASPGGSGPVGGSAGMPAAGGATGGGGTTSAGGSGGAPAGGSGPGGSAGAGGDTGSGPVTVNLGDTHQTIEGFGINDTWAGEAVPTTVYSTTGSDGIGLSLLRVGMSDSGADYSSNIAGDITAAKAAGAKVIGSCWSPPASCKTNNNVNDGGHLITSDGGTCANSWSDTIVKWATGHSLYAMSIGNEPDFASCGSSDPCNGNYPTTLYTANEMVSWVKIAGPKLQAKGIKVITPEASEWVHTWSNVSGGPDVAGKNSSDPLKCGFPPSNAACTTGDGYDYGHWLAKDATAWAAFDILGVHEYDTQHAEPWPSDVTAARKEVWQTEMSGVKWWPEQGPSSDINNGVAVAGWVHSALAVGDASAWFWWWYKAYNTNDNEGLTIQSAATTPTKRYYTIGNYSKFVRPGYVRVGVTGAVPANVLVSAYKGSDGTVAIVAINNGTMDATVPITISGGTAPAMLTPNVTSAMDNLAAKTAVAVTSGAFMASLPATTVTTFVGK